jgi:glycosyltransferase involved in cell wall biosynthesis
LLSEYPSLGKSVLHLLPALGVLPVDPCQQGAAGITSGTLSLADQQTRSGSQVTIIAWSPQPAGSATSAVGTKIRYLQPCARAKIRRWDLRWLLPVIWGSKRLSPEILHVHSDPGLLLAARPQARVFHFRTPVPDHFSYPYRRILSFADAIVCNSAYIADQVRRKLPFISSERLHVVHNGADLSFFEAAGGRIMRQRWGLSDDDFILVYAGALVPEKGVGHAIEGFRQVSAKIVNAHLVIIGSPQLWPTIDTSPDQPFPYIEELVNSADGLPVHFVGALSRGDMPLALAAADLVLVPSLWDEPFGTLVVEAMAAGAPVIAYRSGGIPESIEENITGLLVRKGDIPGLAEAIFYLYQNPQVRHNMSVAARQWAFDRFTWEIAAQKIDRIYEMVLAKPVNQSHKS